MLIASKVVVGATVSDAPESTAKSTRSQPWCAASFPSRPGSIVIKGFNGWTLALSKLPGLRLPLNSSPISFVDCCKSAAL